MRGLAAIACAAALMAQPLAAAAELPSLGGVWDGTIGNLPVRVCFNEHEWGTNGGYYYRSHLQAIALSQTEKNVSTFVEGESRKDAASPRWTLGPVNAASLSGSWKHGAKMLPISLKRVEFEEKDSPCGSLLFQRPRLQGIRTTSKPAVKDGVSYTRLILDHRGHFGEDVNVETFELADSNPATRTINAELRKPLSGMDGWFECIRMAWDSGAIGYTGQTLSPHMISKRWLVVMDDNGWACGGAHPDDASTPRLFDRQTGKQVDVLSWFGAKAIKREKFEGDPNFAETLQPVFRSLILSNWKPEDSDCGDPVRSAEFWDAELTRTGFVFTPSLAHVVQACEEDFKVPFAKLTPYLTPEGKKNVAALQAEVAANVSRR